MSKQMRFTNRLIQEKSPYLQQHAHNPVDWYPWGDEAFQASLRASKPIFLSIGYSTCHWCHVMEEESFEHPEVAALLNEYFISIKVDREERPDIDHIYMTAVQAMTGSGGWPLSIFLTSEKKPFFGGTYFPPEDRMGRSGFKTLLKSIAYAWQNQKDNILQAAEELSVSLGQQHVQSGIKQPLTEAFLEKAYDVFLRSFDATHGGFYQAPKFPSPHNLSFLMRYFFRTREEKALKMATVTLDAMAEGGIYDHLGGGFHRYATDEAWQLPHFEKMLYDQALLLRAYAEAFQLTQDLRYERVAREIAHYVFRDLQSPEGAFYSAEDADSFPAENGQKKSEGAFYVWSYEVIHEAVGEEAGRIFCYVYGVEPNGNIAHDPFEEFTAKNVLFCKHSIAEAAAYSNKSEEEVENILARAKNRLFQIREQWPRPHRDEKILTDWNGLMIASLAFTGFVLGDADIIKKAETAYAFIKEKLMDTEGKLWHRYGGGECGIVGMLDDYVFFTYASLQLYEATSKSSYLKEAIRLSEETLRLFWDQQTGGFFMTAHDAEELIARPKEIYDGAIPSGNALAARNLLWLTSLTGNPVFHDKAENLLLCFSQKIWAGPSAYAEMLQAIDFYLGPIREVIIAAKHEDQGVLAAKRAYALHFHPRSVFHGLFLKQRHELEKTMPFMKKIEIPEQGFLAYVCQNQTCQLPVNSLERFKELLSVN